nr:hypothetical protein [Tanacetum cinerariifolium]
MSADSAVTYTSVHSEARFWSIPSEDPYEEAAQQLLEQAPRSLEYVPDPIKLEDHVPAYIPEHPEDLLLAEDEAPIEAYIPEVTSAPTPPLPPSFLSPHIRPPHTRAAMARMRAAVPFTYHSLLPSGIPSLLRIPLPVPSTSRRAEILEADTPPRKRLLLTAPRPGCEVGESSATAAAARQPRPTMARSVDCSFVDTMETRFRDTERRMMTALEMVNMRVNYQVDVRSRESSEFYSRHHDAQKNHAAVRAEIKVRVAVLETQACRHEWKRQTADDFAVQHIMHTQALEAGALIDRGVTAAMAEAEASRVRNGYDSNARPKTMQEAIEFATELMDKRICDVVENKRKFEGTSRNNQNQPQQNKRQNTGRAFVAGNSDMNIYTGSKPICSKCDYHYEGPYPSRCNNCKRVVHLTRDCRSRPANANNNNTTTNNNRNNNNTNNNNNRNNSNNNQKGNGCYECGAQGHFKRNCPKLKNNNCDHRYNVEITDGRIIGLNTIMRDCTLNFLNHPFNIDLLPVELGSFDVIIGMDWLSRYNVVIACAEKLMRITFGNKILTIHREGSNERNESRLNIISCSKAQEYMSKGCHVLLANITSTKDEDKSKGKRLEDVPVVREFPKVFSEDLPGTSNLTSGVSNRFGTWCHTSSMGTISVGTI